MSYYENFASYKDIKDKSKSFMVSVYDINGGVYISSSIPIECYDEVIGHSEQAIMEGLSWSIWDNIHKKMCIFASGTILRIEVVFS